MLRKLFYTLLYVVLTLLVNGCLSLDPQSLSLSQSANTTVEMDFLHKPLPNLPLPNDIATRYDPTSATLRRINASLIAPTQLESHIRGKIDQLDGWGLLMPISIPFSGPIDVQSILDAHRDPLYDLQDDVIYLINIDEKSKDFGHAHRLDFGMGNYPFGAENRERYFDADPRVHTLTTWFEETNEDLNQNGLLDFGEDSDGDGVLDQANYLPNTQPDPDSLAQRMDAMMTFYEKETHTLITLPLTPLRPRTRYAVIVTTRLKDLKGNSVGSPYLSNHHASQYESLLPLKKVLPEGLDLSEIAFAFSFTTQSTIEDFVAVRDGLYGHGVQKHLANYAPKTLKTLEDLKDSDSSKYANSKNFKLLRGEEMQEFLQTINVNFRDSASDSLALEELMLANRYVDYYVIGSFESPQLYPREDQDGNPLRMNDQSWPADLHRTPAPVRMEQIYFTLVVPRKETSDRKDNKPAPVVILGHGHTGNRFEAINLGPFFARHGLATLSIDNLGHGLSLSEEEQQLVFNLAKAMGVGGFVTSALKDRSRDLNFDGIPDSGGDFWDFYLFHTRDNVRQTALDYMSLIHLIRSFDGQRRWEFDLNQDGAAELAGDFDGDEHIDIGVGSSITMTGGSLGGIMSMLMGSIEPELDAIAPIVGAGGLGIISRRSINQNVRRAILSRVFGPMYVLSPSEEEGVSRIEAMVPNIHRQPTRLLLGTIEGVEVGDTLTATNQSTGERECARILEGGIGRVPLASDIGDLMHLDLYHDEVQIGPECQLKKDAVPYATVNTFGDNLSFQDQSYTRGEKLKALAEGLGLRRASPEFRRFASLGPLVMDRADPAVLGRHLLSEPFTYPGTQQTTGAHALITTGIGDLNVPVDGAATFGRATGILEWTKVHPIWGVSENQVLIDHYILEGMDELKRYTNSENNGVLIDPDNFSQDQDFWAGDVPRLDPPLRVGWNRTDALGGSSALIFAYGSPQGRHGFDTPGVMTDKARQRCLDQCEEGEACSCNEIEVFDVGNFHFELIADYLKNKGLELEAKACYATFDCPFIPPPPAPR